MLKFDKIDTTTLLIYGAGAALVLYVFYSFKGNVADLPKDIPKNLVEGAAGVAGDIVAGTVIGVGNVLGIPETNKGLCEIAKNKGDSWGASKYCTAGDFITWKASGMPSAIDIIKYSNPITASAAIGYELGEKIKGWLSSK